jgi:hypothetical protein
MLSSGMHLGWGLVFSNVLIAPWTVGYNPTLIYLVLVLWFVAAIAGFMVAPFVYGKYSTKSIYVSLKMISQKTVFD